jgi:putative endonuclease
MMPNNPQKRKTGSHYEQLACEHITHAGLKVMARNQTYKVGEIDLIAEETSQKGKVILVFIEVRMRDQKSTFTPLESITATKIRRLRLAIQRYLQQYRGKATEVRIDVIAIQNSSFSGMKLEWIKNAID